jgi:hypothetical protein
VIHATDVAGALAVGSGAYAALEPSSRPYTVPLFGAAVGYGVGSLAGIGCIFHAEGSVAKRDCRAAVGQRSAGYAVAGGLLAFLLVSFFGGSGA